MGLVVSTLCFLCVCRDSWRALLPVSLLLLLCPACAAGALANAVAAVLCTHFGVPDVQRLGYGSVQCLLREAAEEEDSGGSGVAAASSTGSPSAAAAGGAGDSRAADSGPACWTALALTSQTGETTVLTLRACKPASNGWRTVHASLTPITLKSDDLPLLTCLSDCPLLTHHQPVGASSFTAHASGLTAAHGLATLSAAPVLSDLGIWCDWATLYAPVLGPLPAFLSKHQQQLGFRVLEVPGGGLLKLPDVGAGSGSEQLDLQQLRSGMKQAVEQVGVFGVFACTGGPGVAPHVPPVQVAEVLVV